MTDKTRRRTYIRERRQAIGMTLQQLSALTGKSVPFLSQLERGQYAYTQDTIEAIARALGCTIGDLTDPPPSAELINLMRVARRIPKDRISIATRVLGGLADEDDAAEG